MNVSRDVKDGIADTGLALVKREGVLGFAAIVAALMLAAYMWQSWRQTDLIVDVLREAQELHNQTLIDSKARDAVIEKHTETLRLLSERSQKAANHLDRLVAIQLLQAESQAAWQTKDDRTARAVLQRLDDVVQATGISAEELQRLRKKVRPKKAE